MIAQLVTAAISACIVSLYVWQDGIHDCNDGVRYTSCMPQPTPFHHRFHHWPKKLLVPVSLLSMVGLGIAMGDWYRAAMLLSLPGAWFICTRPTTTDAPCMLLAWGSSETWHTYPSLSIVLAIASGAIHERGPVFAAIYAWNPVMLIGLAGVQWWRKQGGPDADRLVGHTLVDSIKAHKLYQDLLDPWTVVYGLRGVLPLAAFGCSSPRAWLALCVAFATRVIGTDTCRFLWWSAPVLLKDSPSSPMWFLMLHVLTFRRAL